MKIELKVLEISEEQIKLSDQDDRIIMLPVQYFNRPLKTNEVVYLNLDDNNNQAKDILNEIFKHN